MTNRNILNEADHLLVKHGVSELPLTMRKAEIIAQFSGWLLLTYDEGKELIEACGAEETAERYPAFTLMLYCFGQAFHMSTNFSVFCTNSVTSC